jgi:hypothetical protein
MPLQSIAILWPQLTLTNIDWGRWNGWRLNWATSFHSQSIINSQCPISEVLWRTSRDQKFVCDETWAKEYKTITDIVVCHEMTHSYFGDAIGCRFFEHSWLKESWATYMEWNWLNDFKVSWLLATWLTGCSRMQTWSMKCIWVRRCILMNAILTSDLSSAGLTPVEFCKWCDVIRKYDSSWSLFDGHLYPGGAWRLHMLRGLLGDVTFWEAVKDYVTTYQFKLVETGIYKFMEFSSNIHICNCRWFQENSRETFVSQSHAILWWMDLWLWLS